MKTKSLVFIGVGVIILFLVTSPLFASSGINPSELEGTYKFAFWAFLLGGISAVSLVLGSMLGLIWQPKPVLIAAFTAFGAGALLAALSVELIAPTVMEFVNESKGSMHDTEGHKQSLEFIFLISGCIAGGFLFFILNEALNSKGGYLRKVSTTISYLNQKRNHRFRVAIKRLSKIKLFRHVPRTHMAALVKHIRHLHIKQGKSIFVKGQPVTRILVIEEGEIAFMDGETILEVIGAGHMIGETALFHHEPAAFTAVAKTPVKAFEINQSDFYALRDDCPELQHIMEEESALELMAEQANNGSENNTNNHAQTWAIEASDHLHPVSYIPSQTEINEAAKKHGSAPLSIWLGIFLDGIPESFVIGAGFLIILTAKLGQGAVEFADVVPYTLIAGLFLSNFPEAMSSSIGMKKMGWKAGKILILWTSLMLMTAVGASIGYFYGAKIPNYIEIGIEGLAAGAMLTMIAQTMIPEAVHIGGNRVTGLSTLFGYMAAVAFKVFE
ncbi:MAG: cyclic nucleotide-binding domain-containing protein [Salinivirgaceae bacterium]